MREYTNGYKHIELEIGAGNGKFLTEHAMDRPDVYFVGIEYSYKACKKLVSKAAKRDLKNICVLFANANEIIESILIKDGYMFDAAYINFPDPWPKKRHHNRRIVNNNLLALIHKMLRQDGFLYIATDFEEYAKEVMVPCLKDSKDLYKNMLDSDYVHYLDGYKQTLYEIKMRSAGKEIYYMFSQKI